ncbi:MAG: alanyl-tRNA editing protein [Lachnospiraceae bacterium]|nr:alanyl-tRNA editing protein [Lachnospiraceae bacterium]MBP5565786.1 alanyl-tRNA editing protein [Lachnospiraceae bacterium]
MKTKKIFDLDAYVTTLDTIVLDSHESDREEYKGCFEVITKESIFSPKGGGQNADKGTINGINVKDVLTIDGELIHFVEGEIKAGDKASLSIDFELRKRRMQVHNAEHLICGLFHKRFGFDNVGFHVSEEYDGDTLLRVEAVMDIDGIVNDDEIKKIEEDANRAIGENVRIYASLPTHEEAQSIDFRSKIDIEDNLRLVIIDGYDVCACCAPCLKSSGEIQVVKILDYFVHRGGMRLTLVAGMDAVKDYAFLHTQNKEFMRLLSSKREDCASSLESKLIHCNEEHEEINNLKKEITKIYLKDIFSNPEYENKKYIVCFAPSFDEVMARNLINETVAKKECALTVCFDNKNDSFRFVTGKSDALDISLKNLATKIRNDLSGRGGGSDKMIQGSIPADEENIIKFFANLETD